MDVNAHIVPIIVIVPTTIRKYSPPEYAHKWTFILCTAEGVDLPMTARPMFETRTAAEDAAADLMAAIAGDES